MLCLHTKTGKVPAKLAKEEPKAVDKLKDEGLAKTQKGANGKTETVLTKAGEKAKAEAQKTEKASPKAPKKDDKAKASMPSSIIMTRALSMVRPILPILRSPAGS